MWERIKGTSNCLNDAGKGRGSRLRTCKQAAQRSTYVCAWYFLNEPLVQLPPEQITVMRVMLINIVNMWIEHELMLYRGNGVGYKLEYKVVSHAAMQNKASWLMTLMRSHWALRAAYWNCDPSSWKDRHCNLTAHIQTLHGELLVHWCSLSLVFPSLLCLLFDHAW